MSKWYVALMVDLLGITCGGGDGGDGGDSAGGGSDSVVDVITLIGESCWRQRPTKADKVWAANHTTLYSLFRDLVLDL